MTSRELLDAAVGLVERPSDATGGLWARAAAILVRQAIEAHVAAVLEIRAPGSQAAQFDAQLVILCEVLGDRELARRTRFTWTALSSASHQHTYELPPTAEELRGWIETADRFVHYEVS